jgi:uncharacterized repeat protein (TIGR01451 family)
MRIGLNKKQNKASKIELIAWFFCKGYCNKLKINIFKPIKNQTTMRIKLLLALSILLNVFTLQSQQFNWADAATGNGYEYGIKATKDAAGNTYILGYTVGTSSNPTNTFEYDGVTYPVIGGGDVYFAKLNTNKQVVWMKTIGGNDGSYYDVANDIHVDPFGDVYIAFKAVGFNITYNAQVLSGIGSIGQYGGEGVLLKVNSNGDYLWHDSGTIASSFNKITTDATGNVYLTGSYYETITLGGAITLTNPSPNTTTDMLIAKYQPNGTILWAKKAGGMPHNTFAYGIDVKINPQTNEVIVLVQGDGAVYFGSVPMPLFGDFDKGMLLVSYNPDGSFNWVKRILDADTNGYGYVSAVDISATGIIGVTGYTPGSGGLLGFYTSDGNSISEHLYFSTNTLNLTSIAFNEFNEAYIAGRSNGQATIGTSPATALLSGYKGFVAKLDIYHQVKWVTEFNAPSWNGRVDYDNGKILFATRIDNDFTYNFGQTTIVHNSGDALFGELADYQLSANGCNITGTIFQDLDANCILSTNDIVQNAVIVKATDANGISRFSISDATGHYDIPVDVGSYTVAILPNPVQASLIHQSCLTQQNVVLNTVGQDANGIDFPMELDSCPLLNVDISSNRRRRCFDSNTLVSYSNSGFAQAENVAVTVHFPEYVTLVSSDHPYTINAQGDYVFSIGALAPNQSGVIHIIDHTECIEGITGLTQCTRARITPGNDCVAALDPDYPNWDKSLVRVDGNCLSATQVQFTISNISQPGSGDMDIPRDYRIYVDNALAITSTFQLNGGQSVVIDYPANGQTIRLEAAQHPAYPGSPFAQDTIEACGSTNGQVSMGFVNTMSMGDDEATAETHCLQIVDSFDPNDKMVSPTGITANHYVKAGTVLDYMIRFQNTGTDTAYKVVIKDALSPYLDPSTIQWGVSSHPYTVKVTGTETPVLEFTFDNINLPTSASNELGSNGFVKFKAATYNSLENDTEVNNNADIYFDYNAPVLTNTAQITISDFVPNLAVDDFSSQHIKVYPNPTSGILVIETDTLQKVEIFTMTGVLIETTDKNQIDLSHYSKGIYLIKISTDKCVALKKVILE